mgnify:FL=1
MIQDADIDNSTIKRRKRISPFRNIKDLEGEIIQFMNVHKANVSNHAKRLSDYFEMCCFNNIVKFYSVRGYEVEIENLQAGGYRYKLSPQGNQENFSNFKVTKKSKKGELEQFGIYHNLAIQSSHQNDIYSTPDISIINYGSIKKDNTHYAAKRSLSYVPNSELVSFCEVKNFQPFPELMFNFIGIVNELMLPIMKQEQSSTKTKHIAPSLMISGKPNEHAKKIKKSLEARYCINIIFDLFGSTNNPFSRDQMRMLKIIQVSEKHRAAIYIEQQLPF